MEIQELEERSSLRIRLIDERLNNGRKLIISSYKRNLKIDKEKAEFVRRLFPVFKDLINKGIEINYLYNSLDYCGDYPEDHESSWKLIETIYDTFVEHGFSCEVKKVFYGYGNKPEWRWNLYLNYESELLKDLDQIYLQIPNAEPDLDCTPKRVMNVNKAWVCEKK